MEPEYGNKQACANCGDEWSPTYSEQGYCDECQEVFEQGNETTKKHQYTAYATVLVWVESDTELTDSEVENKAKDIFFHDASNGVFRRDEVAIEWEAYL